MRILVNGASKTVRELLPRYAGELGAMITPFTGNAPSSIAALGLPWVCDNGCFPGKGKLGQGFDAVKFRRMCQRVAGLPGLEWVTVPDFVERREDGNVYGDAKRTRAMFDVWAPEMERLGLPLAYVLQDGVRAEEVPWERITAVFVGGSDEYKLGLPAAWLEGTPGVATITAEAKRRGKAVHVGRVNSIKRIRYSLDELGADSVDGTATSMFPRIKIPFFADAVIKMREERAAA